MASKKKALKKNPDLSRLLAEVSGLNPSSQGENLSKTGVSAPPQVAAPRPKRFTEVQQDNFVNLIKSRDKIKKRILEVQLVKKDLDSNRDRIEERITKMVSDYGVPVVDAPQNKILFAEPFKAELVWTERGGVIDSEKVAQAFPELLSPTEEVVNLTMLENLLESYEVPESSKVFVEKFKAFLKQLEKSTGQSLVEKKDDRLLDMELYDSYKQSGKISPQQVKAFESESGSHSLRIHKLGDGLRCSQCGQTMPKRKVPESQATCRRCGHTE